MENRNASEYLKRLNAASALRQIPDYDAALVQLEKALELAPYDDRIHMLLGLTYIDTNELDKAIEHLGEAITYASAGGSDAALALGLLLIRLERFVDAAWQLKYFTEDDEDNDDIRQVYVTALTRIENIEQAVKVLLIDDPSEKDVLLNGVYLINELTYLDRHEDANMVIAAIGTMENAADSLVRIASELAEQGRDGEAIEILLGAEKLEPENPRLLTDLANRYYRIEPPRYDEAEHVLAKLTSIKPEDDLAWAMWVASLSKQNKYDEAIQTANKGMAYALKNNTIRGGLSFIAIARVNVYRQVDDLEGALEQVRREQTEYPDALVLKASELSILNELGRFEHAIAVANTFAAIGSSSKETADSYYQVYKAVLESDQEWEPLFSQMAADGEIIEQLKAKISAHR